MRTLILFLLTLPLHATVYYFNGFESGEASQIGGSGGTFSVQGTTYKNGSYGLQVNPTTSATGYLSFACMGPAGGVTNCTAITTLYTGFWFRYHTKPGSNSEQIMRIQQASAELCEFRITSTGTIDFYVGTSPALVGTGTTTLTVDTWYYLNTTTSKGTGGAYELKINGNVEYSGTTNYPSTNNPALIYLGKFNNINSQTIDVFYDDFYFGDAYVSGDSTSKIVAIIPTSNGTTMAWTAGTGGSDYQEVDEIPPDNGTTYVQSTTGGDVALFNLTDCSAAGISGTIIGLMALTKIMDVAATSAYFVRISSSGTTSDTTSTNPGAGAYNYLAKLALTDPHTTAAWTTAGIDAVQIGGKDDSGTNRLRMTAAHAQVFFTPASTAAFYGGAHHR